MVHSSAPATNLQTYTGTPFTKADTSTDAPSSSLVGPPSLATFTSPATDWVTSHANSPTVRLVALAGSKRDCLATRPPASQNGAMKRSGAPALKVAGTMAENHAAVKAPPKSVLVLSPAAGTSMTSDPASVLEMRVRAPRGRRDVSRTDELLSMSSSNGGGDGRWDGTLPPSPGVRCSSSRGWLKRRERLHVTVGVPNAC
ncbi:hypothetical protein Ctob_002415 [Chrysochromulina tobinii]|uniref:Uncharacterized protein n=1 Tax=Chrysochromulina tobinii TaxID=1460289 RepID=A0A0M0JFF2_9EUKA|nr:hypothetical protein Ctob_002415 [Chrysochromulina tobinii]|eukprot:KOO25092.1 hypothetical protein Ctob_002415 [Chrysochromulina sp. CCMP291]